MINVRDIVLYFMTFSVEKSDNKLAQQTAVCCAFWKRKIEHLSI